MTEPKVTISRSRSVLMLLTRSRRPAVSAAACARTSASVSSAIGSGRLALAACPTAVTWPSLRSIRCIAAAMSAGLAMSMTS